MSSLYIKGETGATLGPARQLVADLKIRDMVGEWGVFERDVLTWTARTADVDAGNTTVPDNGQKVSLYLDEERVFHGHVVNPTALLYGVKVSVEGPWWWLLRPDAVSDVEDSEGTTDERPTLIFEEGDLADHIADLVELARDGYSLPLRLGTVSSMFDVPRISYSLQNLAEVLADLLGWCPDAVPWFDHSALSGEVVSATSTTVVLGAEASTENDAYNGLEIEIRSGANAGETRVITDYVGSTKTATISTAWTTTLSAGDDYTLEVECALNVTRRGDATAQSFVIGTDPLVEPFEFRPRIEYEVSQVKLPYAERDADTGAVTWAEQASGTYESGKRQIVPIAGPELADFLPQETFETLTINTTTSDLATALKEVIPGYAELVADYPEGGANWRFGASNVTTTKTISQVSSDGSSFTGLTKSWSNDALAGTRKFILFEDGLEPPEWAVADYGLTKYVVGHWYFIDGNSSTTTPAHDPDRRAALLGTLGGKYYWNASKTDPSGASPPAYQWVVAPRANLSIWTIATADIPAGGVLYKRSEYGFVEPPASLAANLVTAQAWTPWEGTITRRLDPLTVEQILGKKFSVAGSLTAAATAGALPSGYTLDFSQRLATLKLGPPPRSDYGTLVGRTRRSSQDNVIAV